jgi:protein-S-isoprenylcysteine O-methyltransferase Ste14
MTDFLVLITLIFWPLIPLIWIPVHFATSFFRKLGLISYIIPSATWLPLAYLIYQNRNLLISYKVGLPVSLNIIGFVFFIFGSILHIWTIFLLGFLGIIGVPEISKGVKMSIVESGPFSLVRHPTYLAHTFIFSGIFLITGATTVFIITILDVIVINSIIIPLEEKELLGRFGKSYELYKKKVLYRIIPWIY